MVQIGLPGGRFHKRRFPHTEEGRDAAVTYLKDTSPGAVPAATSTVADYLAAWISGVRATVSPKTWRGYEQIVRLWLIPNLGRTRLDRLSVAQVRSYLFALTSTPRRMKDGSVRPPLSEQSAHHHRATLRKALADAVTEGLLTRNVAALAKPPTIRKTERRWLSGDELGRLFDATRPTADSGSRYHAIWVVAGTTGLRSAEMLGLAWSDVDLDGASLRVRHTLYRNVEAGRWDFLPTKTRATRVVFLTPLAVDALRLHRVRQAAEGLRHGIDTRDGLVFTTESQYPIHGADLSRFLKADLVKAGLPVVTVHDLRHSAASFLLSTGTPIQVIASLLGHSSPAITGKLYAHVSDDLKRAAVSRMQEAMDG